MEGRGKMILFFIVLILAGMVLFNAYSSVKTHRYMEERNKVCLFLTEQLNSNITEDSTCVDYYCYYAPYTPPEGYEGMTETLCICDCKQEDGTIISTQVLNHKKSTYL